MRVVVCWLNGVVPVFDGTLAIDENRNGEKFFAGAKNKSKWRAGTCVWLQRRLLFDRDSKQMTQTTTRTRTNNMSVRVRDEDSGENNSSPESKRPRRLRQDDENVTAYDHPDVLCFAARNRRGRFYIPCKNNSFGGVHVDNVLFDSGCSSLLLPFPLECGFPASFMEPARYKWTVSSSRGTGAVHSPVLKISMHIGGGFACTLADKQQPMHLMMLRFHLGTQASNLLLSTPDLRRMLDTNCVGKLNDFLRQLGNRSAPERTYALLGQSYLSRVMYCQINDVALALSEDFDGTENIIHILGRYIQKIVPLVEAFEGFHDLEDNDGDEDEEEYRLSWDLAGSPDDDIEDLDDR
jgi:hypothetical protein